ncbi:MAG: hypothetical protein IPM96_01130 [Ignavibacteria bacterium]|nr:hypothetical protein [Ignavibacteria bacterium]
MITFYTSVTTNLNEGAQLEYVRCSITDPLGNSIASVQLFDNGTLPDTTSGDGKYSAIVSVSIINCLIVGVYNLEYIALNTSGLFSNQILSDIAVINSANVPPVITGTNLPDSVARPIPGDSTLLTISVNVNDSDGLCDLREVTFVTVRPNGVTLPPIPMSGNGNGEFVFSNYVSFSSDPTSYGYFKYTFTARDRSNVLSNPVIDSIKFVQPQ